MQLHSTAQLCLHSMTHWQIYPGQQGDMFLHIFCHHRRSLASLHMQKALPKNQSQQAAASMPSPKQRQPLRCSKAAG